MLRVGLTGGIGSGKSAVASLLAGHGAVVIDADAIARELVVPGGEVLPILVGTFGPDILQTDGTLDRAGLAGKVFGHPDQLAQLDAVMHPRIADRTAELLADLAPDAIVVYDMPLLVENRLTDDWDVIVVVDAPDEVRVQRLVSGRGMAAEDVRRRMAAQATRAERLAVADRVISNAGSRSDLAAAVDLLWTDLTTRRAAGR